jgi:hypothetical protein
MDNFIEFKLDVLVGLAGAVESGAKTQEWTSPLIGGWNACKHRPTKYQVSFCHRQ